jgi:hypothetical protein
LLFLQFYKSYNDQPPRQKVKTAEVITKDEFIEIVDRLEQGEKDANS